MKTKEKASAIAAIIVIVLIVCIGIAVLFIWKHQQAKSLEAAEEADTSVHVLTTIESEMHDIGKLCTAEYCFTMADSFTNDEAKILFIKIQSSAIIQYSGTITAGIDFSNVKVDVDDREKTVQVTIPAAEIISKEVDPDSFKILDEKSRVFNPFSLEDGNKALGNVISGAEEDAINNGILERAQKNAESIITSMLSTVCSAEGYEILPIIVE